MEKLTCASCGSAYLKMEGNTLVCQSCDSRFIREPEKTRDTQGQGAPIRENTFAEGISPFAFDEAECEKALQKWLISDDWAPDDILLQAKLTDVKRVYVPAYFFQIEYAANWSGTIGHNRVESYTNEDGSSTGTRTVTDWSVQQGVTNGIGIVGDIATLDERITTLPISLGREKGWTPLDQFHESDYSERLPFDTDQAEALSNAVKNLSAQAEHAILQDVSADMHQNLEFELSSKRYDVEKLYFPFYLATYTYGGNSYTVALDGRNWGMGFAADRPKCGNLKKAANSFLKIAWIPVIPVTIIGILFLIFDQVASRLVDAILGEIAIASLITFPIALIIGFIARGRFKKNTQAYQESVKQALNSEHADFDQLRTLERNRMKQRKRTKWVRLLLAALTLVMILAIATFNSLSQPHVLRELEAAQGAARDEQIAWAGEVPFTGTTGRGNAELRDEIGEILYAAYGADLHHVFVRLGNRMNVWVGFEGSFSIDGFQEAVI
ncbi:MAG: hypothetical protein FWD84_05720, partial [Oscillospiraceae bacterium]|nr:hypothetical protein [Oscillospiraceae bacterium]